MASASEQLYDTSSPTSYSQWREDATSKYFNTGNGWKDFWRGFTGWPKLLNPNDKDIGRQAYGDYVDDFYNKQEIHNARVAENRQREYETKMSNTAYQRAYQDIKATGLNPAMLLNSAFGPAVTPNSSIAYQRRSSTSRNTSESESRNRSFSASAVLAALLFLLTKI